MNFRRYRFAIWGGLLLAASGAAVATMFYPQIAVHSAPRKIASMPDPGGSAQVKQAFRDAFETQRYEALPEITAALTAAYLKNPNDAKLALLVGHAHLWRVAERGRDSNAGPGVTDSMVLANFYFNEAYRLQPDDHRIGGWLGSTQMALGSIHADERAKRTGYFMLKDSVRAFPEFNNFTLAYVMSRLPAGDPKLAEATQAMWTNLDLCVGHKVDRQTPDLTVLGANDPPAGPRRICFNVPAAPHNVEGFFLAFGDLLVKTGDAQRAKAIYQQARVSSTYDTWPFKSLLEERLRTADERAAQFASSDARSAPEMISTSAHTCTVCHAR